MTLIELLAVANEGYPDHYLGDFHTPEGKFNPGGTGDTLARFVVSELIETFEGGEDDEGQLESAIFHMEAAVEDIESVIAALTAEQERRASLCPGCGECRSVDCWGDYRCEVCDKPCPGGHDGGGPA